MSDQHRTTPVYGEVAMGSDEVSRDMVRKTVLDQVERGLMSPRQAELAALNAGIDLLGTGSVSIANPDPLKEPWWTFAMVIAWIAWRTSSAVLDNWDDYVLTRQRWVRVPHNALLPESKQRKGYILQPRMAPSASLLSAHEAFDGFNSEDVALMSNTIRESRECLFRKCASGKVHAVALKPDVHCWPDAMHSIAPTEWPYLELCYDDYHDVLRLRHDLLRLAYLRVRFNAAEILETWPKRSATAASRKMNQIALTKIFREEVKESKETPTLTKKQFLDYARRDFSVSKQSAEMIWKQVIEE
ncbi:MAG: hypothetical protein ABL893_20635, partial [Hyphomicrobium sp.]